MAAYYLGVDPGSSHMGLAALDAVGELQVRTVRLHGASTSRRVGKIRHALEDLGVCADGRCRTDITVVPVCEEPPPSVTSKVRRGAQAPIGWQLGRPAGILECLMAPVDLRFAPVSAWRSTMMGLRRERGMLDAAPSRKALSRSTIGVTLGFRRDVEGRLWARYRKCGHDVQVPTMSALQDRCPLCAKKTPHVKDIVRDIWKRYACELVRVMYPEPYQELVDDARSRARRQDQPDHQLVGVPDGCEAACIALHARRTHTTTLSKQGAAHE